MALARTASLAFVKGDHEAVRRYGEASLPVLRRLGDDVGHFAGTLGLMATSALALGDLDRARALAEEALEVGRRSGDLMTRVVRVLQRRCRALPGAGSSTRPSA